MITDSRVALFRSVWRFGAPRPVAPVAGPGPPVYSLRRPVTSDAMASDPDFVDRFLPLKPDVFLILLILADADHHGYGLIQEAEERTEGKVRLQAGALYRRLKWMLEEGLIEELDPAEVPGGIEDERRRYYRITGRGRTVAAAEAARMASLVETARSRDLLEQP